MRMCQWEEQTPAFSYIDDVPLVIAHSIHFPGAVGEVFNVGAYQAYKGNELGQRACEVMKVSAQIIHLPPRKKVMHAFSSHKKAKQFFDAPSLVSLNDGISRIAA